MFIRVCNTHSLVWMHRTFRSENLLNMEIVVCDNYAIANLLALMNIVMNFNKLKTYPTNNMVTLGFFY